MFAIPLPKSSSAFCRNDFWARIASAPVSLCGLIEGGEPLTFGIDATDDVSCTMGGELVDNVVDFSPVRVALVVDGADDVMIDVSAGLLGAVVGGGNMAAVQVIVAASAISGDFALRLVGNGSNIAFFSNSKPFVGVSDAETIEKSGSLKGLVVLLL